MLRLLYHDSQQPWEFDAPWRQTRGAAQSLSFENAFMLRLLYNISCKIQVKPSSRAVSSAAWRISSPQGRFL